MKKDNETSIKSNVTITVKLKPYKSIVLNYANEVFEHIELYYINRSDKDTLIHKSITVDNPRLINFFSIYMGNPQKPIEYNHAFLISNKYDTVKLCVTDSSDIYFSNKNSNKIDFIDKYVTGFFVDYKKKIFSGSPLMYLKDIRNVSLSNLKNSITDEEDKKTITCYINQSFHYASLKLQIENKVSDSNLTKQIDSFAQFLSDCNVTPNMQLLDIFLIIEKSIASSSSNKKNNSCNFIYVNSYPRLFENYISQSFLFNRLINYSNKSTNCWNQAVNLLKKKEFYEKNKGTIDSVFLTFTESSRKIALSKFYMIDAAREKKTILDILNAGNSEIFFIDFWATWCVPCKEEDIVLNRIKHKLAKKIEIIRISLDETNDFSKWKKEVDDISQNYLAIEGFKSNFCKLLKINSIPRFILINKEGRILNDNFLRPSDPLFVSEINKYASIK